MKYISYLVAIVPYTLWFFVALLISSITPNFLRGVYSNDQFLALIFLNSPLITWLIIAIGDIIGLYEGDNKAGKYNQPIAWVLYVFLAITWSQVGLSVFIPQLVLLTCVALASKYNSLVVDGTFRKWLVSQFNLIIYGKDWKPSLFTINGSASLSHNPTAAVYYHNKEFIFGTALTPPPLIRNSVTRKFREWYIDRSAHRAGKRAYSEHWNKKISKEKNREIAIKGFSSDPTVSPIMSATIDGHIFIVSGSGGGKTASFAMPNALCWDGGSFVCIDPKSEVHAVTSEARQKLGHTTYKLQPDAPNEDSDSFNAIGWIDPSSSSFTADCMTVASWIFPENKGSGGDGGAEFYKQKAKDMFSLVLAKILAEHWQSEKNGEIRPFPTLQDAYKFLIRSDTEIRTSIEELYEKLKELPPNSQFYGPSTEQIKEWCGPFVGGDVERTYPNIVASVTKEIFWLGDPTLSSIVTGKPKNPKKGRGFNAEEITTGKTSIYICIPLEILTSTPSLARLAVGGFMSAIFRAKGGSQGQTLFLIDEMMTLGNFPILHDEGLQQGRGYGITLCGIVQGKDSLDNAAGQGTYNKWMDSAKLQAFLAIRNIEGAKLISEQMGETTIEELSISAGHSKQRGKALGADGVNRNISTNTKARKVMDPREIMDLPREYAVVFMGDGVPDPRVGKKPMVIGTCYYKMRPELMAVANDNPYERQAVNDSAYAVPDGDIASLVKQRVRERRAARGEHTSNEKLRPISETARMQEWNDVDWAKKARILAEKNPQYEATIKAIDGFLNGDGADLDTSTKSKIAECISGVGTSLMDTPISEKSSANEEEKESYRARVKKQLTKESERFDEEDFTFDDFFTDNSSVVGDVSLNVEALNKHTKELQAANALNDAFENSNPIILDLIGQLTNDNSDTSEDVLTSDEKDK